MGIVVIALLLSRLGLGATPDAVVPETIVRISIFDLGSFTKAPAPRLPADYGKAVAEKIAKKKDALLECLSRYSLDKESWKVNLKIQPNGSGQVEFAEEDPNTGNANDCAKKVLTAIRYPTHPMKHAVDVDFPLELSRRSL